MRRTHAILAAIAAAACRSSGGLPTPADTRALADRACPRVTHAPLYRIRRGDRTAYLLGTRHAGVSLAKFPTHVRRHFAEAKLLVVESRVDQLEDAEPPPKSERPRPLSTELGHEHWAKYRWLVGDELAAVVDHAGAPAAVSVLATLYEDRTALLDQELLERARAMHKEIVALEDADRSEEVGEKMFDVSFLRQAIDEVPSREALAESTRNNLARYCGRGVASAGTPDKIMEERNRAWIAQLEPLLARTGVFVAVGVFHFDGPSGLPALFSAAGYEVTALPSGDAR